MKENSGRGPHYFIPSLLCFHGLGLMTIFCLLLREIVPEENGRHYYRQHFSKSTAAVQIMAAIIPSAYYHTSEMVISDTVPFDANDFLRIQTRVSVIYLDCSSFSLIGFF